MWNSFSNMLSGWQWLLLGLIPPAIVALYFLKLRRQPLEVPSTYLWQRTLEDMHVNSLWQRLRQSLLLLLQLLLVAMIMLACLRPSWQSEQEIQNRTVIMLDTSASMSATDIEPTRLDHAKLQALEIIKRMEAGDAAMIISFSDRARVEQPFTTNRRQLERRLADIHPTQRTTDISEGLRAAGGRANPGRSADVPAEDAGMEETANASIFADPLPADVFIFSDGGFRKIPDFSWGNLSPKYVAIGTEKTPNVAILSFSVAKPPSGGDQLQAFAQLKNFGAVEIDITLELGLSDSNDDRYQVIDAAEKAIKPDEIIGVEFTFAEVDSGVLRLMIDDKDSLAMDNVAYAAINPENRANVLLVTEGNEAIETVLGTEDSLKLAKVRTASINTLSTEAFKQAAVAGFYDLIIFDACTPEEMPNANTLFFGSTPGGEAWRQNERAQVPQIIDTDLTHPLMNYLDFGDVNFVYATPVEGPTGSQVLIDTDAGSIATVAPRAGFEDVVLGFNMVYEEDGERYANTDWPRRLSFPLFFRNTLAYLGGASRGADLLSVKPGEALSFSVDTLGDAREVETPSGSNVTMKRTGDASFSFFDTDDVGTYTIDRDGSEHAGPLRFTVNLFDETESDLGVKSEFETTWRAVEAQAGFESTRQEIWPWIVIVAICVLLAEWYIYNQRVYL